MLESNPSVSRAGRSTLTDRAGGTRAVSPVLDFFNTTSTRRADVWSE